MSVRESKKVGYGFTVESLEKGSYHCMLNMIHPIIFWTPLKISQSKGL